MNVLTGEAINDFRIKTIYVALKLQARTGMKISRVSAVKAAKQLGYQGRTAAQLVEDMKKKHPDL
jgi:hypothetical protein